MPALILNNLSILDELKGSLEESLEDFIGSKSEIRLVDSVIEFVESIATMKQDGEAGAGELAGTPLVMENDVAVTALNALISRARTLVCLDQADKQAAEPTPSLPARDVYFACLCTDEYQSGPAYGKVAMTHTLVSRIESLTRLCEQHNLSEAREPNSSCDWFPVNIRDKLSLECDELVVTRSGFWWRSSIGESNGCVESWWATIEQLRAALESTRDIVIIDGEKHSQLLDAIRQSLQKT